MKKLMIVAVMGAMLLGPLAGQARAGDREWAVAGKVLAGALILDAITSPCHETTVVYRRPVCPPPRVVHHPVVVHRPPVRRTVVRYHPVAHRPVAVPRCRPVRRPHPRRVYRAGYRDGYRVGYRHGRRSVSWGW